MLKKIGVIGGGNIGGVLIQEIVRRGLAGCVGLVDILPPELAKGKCLDIAEGTPIIASDVKLVAGKEYSVLAGADMVINTAGVPRKPRPDGTIPSREELLVTNLKITDQVADGIKKHCPGAIIISIANPLDAIVYHLYRKLGHPKAKILGMAGVLDSSRYRYFVAEAAGVSVESVEALVLGGHGDDMVPIRSCCRIAGMPVEKFLSTESLDAIEKRTRGAGAEVVKLLGSGSAFASPAWAALAMAEAIAHDRKKILACCALLEGEYGVDRLFVGVPCILGAGGIERIIEADLNEAERVAFQKSVASVTSTCAEVDKLAP
ncbi:MAG: malate dehydrogenase [Candidatus Riflebacteria bacterium]|nr:malate dehydrogenase [Candidatus Riflebacteria bacterium]